MVERGVGLWETEPLSVFVCLQTLFLKRVYLNLFYIDLKNASELQGKLCVNWALSCVKY